ncbi:MAG: hypothetical protein IKX89_02135, partial [Firmicutes bacterium]|nr:hypothetical protein [Bacillota bacterium]
LLQHIPTAILELTENGIIKYPGKYDYYEQKREELTAGKSGESPKSAENTGVLAGATENKLPASEGSRAAGVQNAGSSRATGAEGYRAKKESDAAARKAARQLAQAEEAVSRAEAEVSRLEAELCRPEVYSDPEKAAETGRALEKAKADLDDAYWQWMELN